MELGPYNCILHLCLRDHHQRPAAASNAEKDGVPKPVAGSPIKCKIKHGKDIKKKNSHSRRWQRNRWYRLVKLSVPPQNELYKLALTSRIITGGNIEQCLRVCVQALERLDQSRI